MLSLNDGRVKDTGEMYYILTPPGRKMKSGFYSYVPVSLENTLWFSMSYESYEARLLKKPFETGCINYADIGYESRGDCYESCIRKEVLNKTDSILPGVNVMENDTKPIVPLMTYCSPDIRVVIMASDRLCHQQCSAKDCLSIVHIPRKLSSTRNTDFTTVATIAPQTPVIRASCQPAFPLTNYLTGLVATFGFWLGISALGIFRFVERASKAVREAYSSEVKPKKKVPLRRRIHYQERHPVANYFSTENSYDNLIYDFLVDYMQKRPLRK